MNVDTLCACVEKKLHEFGISVTLEPTTDPLRFFVIPNIINHTCQTCGLKAKQTVCVKGSLITCDAKCGFESVYFKHCEMTPLGSAIADFLQTHESKTMGAKEARHICFDFLKTYNLNNLKYIITHGPKHGDFEKTFLHVAQICVSFFVDITHNKQNPEYLLHKLNFEEFDLVAQNTNINIEALAMFVESMCM